MVSGGNPNYKLTVLVLIKTPPLGKIILFFPRESVSKTSDYGFMSYFLKASFEKDIQDIKIYFNKGKIYNFIFKNAPENSSFFNLATSLVRISLPRTRLRTDLKSRIFYYSAWHYR